MKSSESQGPPQAPRQSRAGMWSVAGALIAAVLASACCWLPLALVGLGASTLGIASFFEEYRVLLLIVTGLLLASGFYFVYFRKPKCAEGQACAVPNPRLRRINRISLWIATVFVVAMAAFPNYVGAFIGSSDSAGAVAAAQSPARTTRTYAIAGMTCEGCTGHIEDTVAALQTVAAVEVSYERGTATVVFTDSGGVDDDAVMKAVASAGYAASLASSKPASEQE